MCWHTSPCNHGNDCFPATWCENFEPLEIFQLSHFRTRYNMQALLTKYSYIIRTTKLNLSINVKDNFPMLPIVKWSIVGMPSVTIHLST